MGGKAFAQILPTASFPRMPPSTYNRLKSLYTQRLCTLYRIVKTPPEDPEKEDHGDLDFLVVFPRDGLTHEDVKHVLDAVESVSMEGSKTSNFAVPTDEESSFVQLDVYVCADEGELERIFFWHSYGGISMMLGRIARSIEMKLGTSDLKISNPEPEKCHPDSFMLSEDFNEIVNFFGLSLDMWREGFSTRRALFEWVASSRFFFPARLAPQRTGKKNYPERRRLDRDIYQAFCVFVHDFLVLQGEEGGDEDIESRRSINQGIRKEALQHFAKAEDYSKVVHANWVRMRLSTTFTGRKVVEWTNLWGLRVSDVMKETRRRIGGDDAIAHLEEEEIKQWVLRVHKDLQQVWDNEKAQLAIGAKEAW